MSTIENLTPSLELLRERIREEKKKSGLTIDQLAEETGISKTAVIKMLANAKLEPKLTDVIALCKYFDISVDTAFCFSIPAAPVDTPQDVLDRNRQLELEVMRLSAANISNEAQIRSIHSLCYLLVFVSAMLAMSLVAYLVIDSQITDAGIIRSGKLSGAAWIFIGLIAASVIACGITVLRIIRKERKEGKKCRNA